MRITTTAHILLAVRTLEATTTDGGDTTIVALPDCAQVCHERVLPQFQCAPGKPCHCDTDGALNEALSSCVIDSCATSMWGATSVTNATIQAQRLRADICKLPIRDRSSLVLGVAFTLFGLASLSLCARVASLFTLGSRRSFGADDTATALAYAVLLTLVISTYYAQQYGLGQDVWNVKVADVATFLRVSKSHPQKQLQPIDDTQWHFVSSILYYAIISLAKIAVVFLYLRTWPGHTRHWFVLCCRAVILVLFGFGLSSTLTTIFACSPVDLNWSLVFTQGGTCAVHRTVAAYIFGAINVLLNIVLMLLLASKSRKHRSAASGTIR